MHVTPAGSGLDGVNANVLTPPGGLGDSVNGSGVPVGHSSVNALAVTFTGSLNVTAGVIVAITLVAPSAGTVLLTVGGVSILNEKVKSDGSWVPNESATRDATTVTLQVVPAGSGEAGVSVNVVPLPGKLGDTVNGSGVPVGHSSLNARAVT